MPIILYLETATRVCSVALAKGEKLLSLRETSVSNSHSELITVFIQEVMAEAGLAIDRIDAVAVSKGPGSYTGLRIGVSVAKGICFAIDKPLISIGTLQAMAYGAVSDHPEIDTGTLICPMLDARRMEVYYALFDRDIKEIKADTASVITEDYFSEIVKNNKLLLLGDGAEKCRPLFIHQTAISIVPDFTISARYMIKHGLEKYMHHQFENVAYFEPFYLKDFVAGKPVVKGLHD
jgi:tRNA threonylcarbamoyladenosine biosynthesis protein TsaB